MAILVRGFLDTVYRLSGAAAAACLIIICLIVVAQVGGRAIDEIALALGGQRFGLIVPSAAEFGGFFLAGASFLALAYTLRHGAHIRVSLVIGRLPDRVRRRVEGWCVLFGGVFSALFTWNAALLVLDSIEFDERSYGIISVPLWIPQSVMTIGLAVLTIAFADEFVRVAGGRPPRYEDGDVSPADEV